MRSEKTLYYFTNSFPYGNAYQWEKSEVEFLANVFARVVIIPFSYEGNRSAVDIEGNVEVLPVVAEREIRYRGPWQITSIFNRRLLYYLREFCHEQVYQSSYWFKVWLQSVMLTNYLVRSDIFRLLRDKDNKDYYILYFYWGNNQTLLAPFLKKVGFQHVYSRFHGFDLYKERLNGYQPFKGQILKSLKKAVAISEMGKNYIVNTYKVPVDKVMVSRLGTNDYGLAGTDRYPDSFHFVSCSRLIPLKRVEMIAKSLALLDERFYWTHIGDGETMNVIREIVSENDLDNRVNLLGWVQSDSVKEIYRSHAFDFFLQVSSTEGIPVSIMEAMSFGLPVLTTDVGGIYEIVDNSCGALMPEDLNEKKLALFISEFIQNDLERLSKGARQKFLTYSIIDKCNESLYKILVSEST